MSKFPFSIQPKNDDERFMCAALREAWQAYEKGEVPVGAVLVHEGQVVARGHNQVELLRDATAHAEMLCMTAGSAAVENWRLSRTTLYCTMEPCAMCAGAMLLSRVQTLVWGTADIRHGANGSWIEILAIPHPTHQIEIRQGVLGAYAAELMRSFFQKRRQDKR